MMIKRILTVALFTLLSVGLTSCKCLKNNNNKNEIAMIKDFSLEGSEWKLEYLQDIKFEKPKEMRTEYIALQFKDGYASTSDGCNGMSGDFTQNGEKLTFGPFRSTRMYCDWQLFSVPFYEVKSFHTDGKQLKLMNENQEVIATYSRL